YDSSPAANPVGMSSYDKALEAAQPADTDTPAAPRNFTGTAVSTTTVNLTWSPAADSGYGVACYTVNRAGTPIGTTMATSFADAGAQPGADSYSVSAIDGVGHRGPIASTTVITSSGTTVSESPNPVMAGANLTATWSGI